MTTLREAVRFYGTRDKMLSDAERAHVTHEPPFGRTFSEAEIDDVVAFLGTLADAD